ncbi:MAG: hypothetical protein HeimC3_15270 [Candidatus Heimdallarchaeota archaeon LC_3]|nr:MAG: hypothetical protein HeimC3_15270 [Candidatus Heimdallarchaeota archaeon LC_3]
MNKTNERFVSDLTIDDEYGIIEANKTIKDAALKMKELGIPDLVVVDDKQQKKVLGVIADFDIVTGLIAEDKPSKSTKVTDIMYTIEPVTPKTTVLDTFTRMRDLDVPIIPVIDNDKLIGVVSITDTWGYLPEKYEDQKGLIAVSDPKFANYFFTLTMVILYFFFGILTPVIGIAGFFKAEIAGSASFVTEVTYYLFEARGGGFIFRYIDFQGNNVPWIIITVYSMIFLLVGIISTVAILQWAYGDYKMIKENKNWRNVGFAMGLINIIIIWFLFIFIIFSGAVRVTDPQIDFLGMLLSGISILFLLLAISRDYFFKEKIISSDEEEN